MYKTAIISGDISNISPILNRTIESINAQGGTINNIIQSQSTSSGGFVIITITILYSIKLGW